MCCDGSGTMKKVMECCWEAIGDCCPPKEGEKAEAGGCCSTPVDAKGQEGSCCPGSPVGDAPPTADEIRQAVRGSYAKVAASDDSGCGGEKRSAKTVSFLLGYSEKEVKAAPEGANMGLGCGNPQAIAQLKPGEVVVDLGSGGGFDCFLAAEAVGETGRVIGVDMTPEMLSKARVNAEKTGRTNVEFRLGEIEHLPVPDATADVIISNCVINLSPDRPQVYRDAFRALKPGGRLAISDVVRLQDLPEEVLRSIEAMCGCIAGAASVEELEGVLGDIGFGEVRVTVNPASAEFIREWMPGSGLEGYVAAAGIEAVKPATGCEGPCDDL